MNKYLVIGNYNLGADVIHVGLAAGNLTLSYLDKQIVLDGSSAFTAADKSTIESALVSVWKQVYTDASLNVSLSQAISSVTI